MQEGCEYITIRYRNSHETDRLIVWGADADFIIEQYETEKNDHRFIVPLHSIEGEDIHGNMYVLTVDLKEVCSIRRFIGRRKDAE